MNTATGNTNTTTALKHLILITCLAIFAASCGTSKRLSLAEKCARAYPCTDSIVIVPRTFTDTIMLAGYDDTVTVSVPCPPNLTDTLRIPVTKTIHTPAKYIPVKITVQDTITARIDSALRVAYAELQLKYLDISNQAREYELQRNEARKSRGRSWWPWVLVGLLSAGIVYLVFVKKK